MIEIEALIMRPILLGTAAVALYGLFVRRLADFVQPRRLEMAELGERMLASAPSAEREEQIRFYLDNAFSGWVMAADMVILPMAAAGGLIKHAAGRLNPAPPTSREDEKIALLFMLSSFAANPVCGLIVVLELAVLLVAIVTAGGPAAFTAALRHFVRAEARWLSGRRRSAHA